MAAKQRQLCGSPGGFVKRNHLPLAGIFWMSDDHIGPNEELNHGFVHLRTSFAVHEVLRTDPWIQRTIPDPVQQRVEVIAQCYDLIVLTGEQRLADDQQFVQKIGKALGFSVSLFR